MADTSTVALLDTLLAELQAHLPAQLVAYDMPAVQEWCFGDRDVTATPKCPCIQVDIAAQPQDVMPGGLALQHNRLVVIAVVAAPDPDTLHRQLVTFADVLRSVVESNVTVNGMKLLPRDVDYSPSLTHQNRLKRAVLIECELLQPRALGAI